MLQLLLSPVSPWSEKACWALDARSVSYTRRRYPPLLAEPGLRILLRRAFGRVSVPVLIDGTRVIPESLSIARYADSVGSGPCLFPEGKESAILAFESASERGLCAGRALTLMRMLDDREALCEQVPAGLRAALGPLALGVGRAGIERILHKYGASDISVAEHRAMLTGVLVSLRADLARTPRGEPALLLGEFSYADIVMVQVLSYVSPPDARYLVLGPATRRCYEDAALQAQFPDLLTWRDALYTRYRTRTDEGRGPSERDGAVPVSVPPTTLEHV